MSTHHDADAAKLKHCLGRLLAAGEVDGTTDPSAAVQTLIRAHPEYGRRPVGPLRTAARSGPTGLLPYSGCARIKVCTAAEGSVVPSTSPAASSRPRQCLSFAASASWCVLIVLFRRLAVNLRRTLFQPLL